MSLPVTRISTPVEQTEDRQTLAIQSSQKRATTALNDRGAAPTVTGPVVFELVGQLQRIEHRLARVPSEWYAVDVTVGYGAFRREAWDDKTISIRSAFICTAVFKIS